MGDFSTKQPKPQSRPSTQFDAKDSGTPKSGISEAPQTKPAGTGAGPGIPANSKKIR